MDADGLGGCILAIVWLVIAAIPVVLVGLVIMTCLKYLGYAG